MVQGNLTKLIRDARALIGLHTDVAFARFLGVSRRTVQRHLHEHGMSGHADHSKFVRALFAADPGTARMLAEMFRVDISDLEPKATPPTPRFSPVGPGHVAMLVLATSEAHNLPPREARALLSTVFREAVTLRVNLNELAPLLVAQGKSEGKAPS